MFKTIQTNVDTSTIKLEENQIFEEKGSIQARKQDFEQVAEEEKMKEKQLVQITQPLNVIDMKKGFTVRSCSSNSSTRVLLIVSEPESDSGTESEATEVADHEFGSSSVADSVVVLPCDSETEMECEDPQENELTVDCTICETNENNGGLPSPKIKFTNPFFLNEN